MRSFSEKWLELNTDAKRNIPFETWKCELKSEASIMRRSVSNLRLKTTWCCAWHERDQDNSLFITWIETKCHKLCSNSRSITKFRFVTNEKYIPPGNTTLRRKHVGRNYWLFSLSLQLANGFQLELTTSLSAQYIGIYASRIAIYIDLLSRTFIFSCFMKM